MSASIILPRPSLNRRLKRLTATLYAYSFIDDLILLYPVYVLLFADTGLTVAEISSLFVVWSVTGFVLEIPSGVWADAVSRRLLLAVAPVLGALGFGLWTVGGSYWAFLAGFVLWGTQGAMQSGALEALVYEELEHLEAADRYAAIMGRARALGVAAVLVATALAGPVLGAAGFMALGIASVAARLTCAAVALGFPEHRALAPDGEDEPGYRQVLIAGLREAAAHPPVRRAVLLVAGVTAVWGGLEEYDPLLAESTGVADTVVPWLVMLTTAGVTAGGLLAGLGRRLSGRGLAAVIALGAVALAVGAGSGRPIGFVPLAAAFCAFQFATVLADARLQAAITGPSRATVTSMAGLTVEVFTVGVYGLYGVGSGFAGHGAIFAAFAVPYLLMAALLAVRRPST